MTCVDANVWVSQPSPSGLHAYQMILSTTRPCWRINKINSVPRRLATCTPAASGTMASKHGTFKRVQPIQFIAADPGMQNGGTQRGFGALGWGIWRVDPGPRGVRLGDYKDLEARGGVAPRGGWRFDKEDWWVEENGLIMESPEIPLPSGRYVVTGGRETTAVLVVDGDAWELLDGARLHDVTHLPCRSARYRPAATNASPANAHLGDFPVTPGAEMPVISGCSKQDYAVLFITAIEVKEGEM